jgi:O-antigen ligase
LQFNLAFVGLAIAFIALPFSIKICHAGMLLFLLMWAIEGDWKSKIEIIRRSFLLQLITALFVLNVVGLFYSRNLIDGWFVIEKKIFFLLLPIGIATSNKYFTSHHINKLLYLFICTCFIGSFISLWNVWSGSEQMVVGDYLTNSNFSELNEDISKSWFLFSYVSLANGIHIHPTFFALYIAFCVVLLFNEIITNRLSRVETGLLWLMIVYFVIFLIFLSSRIVIGALFIIMLVYIIYELRYASNKGNAVIAALSVPLISLLLYINPVSRYRNIQEIRSTSFNVTPNTEYKTSVQIRLSLWSLAVRSINPMNFLAGTGTGDVKATMEESGKKYAISNVLNSYDPHNQFLFNLLSHGFVGLLLLILNFLAPMYYAWRQRDYLYLIFAFLCGSICLTESAFELQKGIVFYALINSLLLLRLDAFAKFNPAIKDLR